MPKLKINEYKTPHPYRMSSYTHTNTDDECRRYPFSCEIFQISYQG